MINFLKTFHGGVHVDDNKFLTENSPIKKTPLPKKVRIPLSQHAGNPAEPIVKIGDYVKTGQKIGQANGFISANIHSSVTGKVLNISKFPHPVSGESLCVEIESIEKEEFEYLSGDEDNILERIKDAGVIGMGGAMFPTHVKLQPPKDKKIDTVILNAAECEPFVTSDYRMMIERPDDVISGLKLVMKILNVDNALIGVEANKKAAIKILQEKTRNEKNIRLEVLATKYPQGGEKQIIKVLLNREVPSGGLPFDVGVVAHNVGTVIAVYEAINFKKPLYERVVTVTGSCVKDPSNWLVRIGTLFSDLIDWSGGLKTSAAKLIMGGPMMGIAQYTFDVPVVKGTNAILVMGKEDVRQIKKESCIRCGKCVVRCPIGLDPGRLAVLIEKGKLEDAKAAGVLDCIECGVCAYSCPANRDIVQLIKYAKKQIMQNKKTANK